MAVCLLVFLNAQEFKVSDGDPLIVPALPAEATADMSHGPIVHAPAPVQQAKRSAPAKPSATPGFTF